MEEFGREQSQHQVDPFLLLSAENVPPQEAKAKLDRHLIVLHQTPTPVEVKETVEDKRFNGLAVKGDINFIPARAENTCEWRTPLTFLRMELEPRIITDIAERENISLTGDFSLALRNQDDKMAQILMWMMEEERAGNPQGDLYRNSLQNLLVLHLFQQYYPGQEKAKPSYVPDSPGLKKAMEYMQDNYNKSISLDELVQLSNVSPSHFISTFKQLTGITPHQYLLKIRIDRAKELLLSDLPISEIAYRLGFSDQSHFSRHFKKVAGLAPLKWRKNFVQKKHYFVQYHD